MSCSHHGEIIDNTGPRLGVFDCSEWFHSIIERTRGRRCPRWGYHSVLCRVFQIGRAYLDESVVVAGRITSLYFPFIKPGNTCLCLYDILHFHIKTRFRRTYFNKREAQQCDSNTSAHKETKRLRHDATLQMTFVGIG